MKKKLTTSKLKAKLDNIFSQYIRLKYADKNGNVSCYTCGQIKNWKQMQNGHFVSRSHLATRFDEDNVRVQCVGCNVFGGGKPAEFGLRLEEEHKGIVLKLMRKSQTITKDYPYLAKIEKYRLIVEKLSTGIAL